MPVLSNSRHERFAQELASGKTADEAYALAGYKPDRGHASRLAANGSVQARLIELQSRAAEGVIITRQRVLEEMARLAFAEVGDPHIKAADKRNALKDLATMEGWIIERREVGAPNEFEKYQSADELRAVIRDRFGLVPVHSEAAKAPASSRRDARRSRMN